MGNKTAIQLVTKACARLQVEPPGSLVHVGRLGNLFLELINEELADLIRKKGPDGQGWPTLNKSFEFRTIGGQEAYTLPVEAESFLEPTLFVDNPGIKIPQVSPTIWSYYKSLGSSAPVYEFVYLLSADELTDALRLLLQPVPAEGRIFRLELISKFCVRPALGRAPSLQEVEADSNTTVFPDDLVTAGIIWRYKQSVGLDFLSDAARYEKILDDSFMDVVGRQELSFSKAALDDDGMGRAPVQSWQTGL